MLLGRRGAARGSSGPILVTHGCPASPLFYSTTAQMRSLSRAVNALRGGIRKREIRSIRVKQKNEWLRIQQR